MSFSIFILKETSLSNMGHFSLCLQLSEELFTQERKSIDGLNMATGLINFLLCTHYS